VPSQSNGALRQAVGVLNKGESNVYVLKTMFTNKNFLYNIAVLNGKYEGRMKVWKFVCQ
jgi:hypothetical protein